MIIREINTADSEALANLTKQVEASSEYMLWEPAERNMDPNKQRKMIEKMVKSKNSTIFVAEEKNTLIGFIMSVGGPANRNKHSAYIVIGILKEYRGQGVGTKLFQYLEQWALHHDIHRLELTVVTRNEIGISLYQKMGFEIEGRKRDSLLINSEYVDEYYMSKLL